ncbi:MAG: hypothetical protein M1828_003229 [Chrysothrix sp. TS-e1954]|nr:MAG: hypothetical protein M1828_003229 [Chrysothrix sp. TS-e1954]
MDPTPTPAPHVLSPPLPSSTLHRRIALQSPLDLLYLRNNALRAARAKIDLHLPPDAASDGTGEGDTMRRTVEREVASFVEKVFDGVRRGSEINGIPGEDVEMGGEGGEEYEPLDTRLAERISGLHAQIEALNPELANTRRSAAKQAAKDFEEGYMKQSALMEEIGTKREEAALAAGQEMGPLDLQPGFQGRDDQVRKTWETALEGLRQTEADLQRTRERADQAAEVVEHLQR